MMMLLTSMLLAGSTLTNMPARRAESTALPMGSMTLRMAASEAARRDARANALNIPRDAPSALRQRRPSRTRHHSVATRITAIAAGSIAGALGGIVAGALIGAAGGDDGALVGMVYGMPIGAAAGGLLTAYYVR